MYYEVPWDDNLSNHFNPQQYLFFKVNVDKAVNAFENVNRIIQAIASDIDQINSDLSTLEQKFNTYEGLNDNMAAIKKGFNQFKDSLIDYNKKLLQAANETCDKISESNVKYHNQTQNLKEGLNRINSFDGQANLGE